jgi:hypothetical protein
VQEIGELEEELKRKNVLIEKHTTLLKAWEQKLDA